MGLTLEGKRGDIFFKYLMFQRVHLAKRDLPGCQQIFKNMFMITRFNLIRNEKGGGLHVANSLKISHYLLAGACVLVVELQNATFLYILLMCHVPCQRIRYEHFSPFFSKLYTMVGLFLLNRSTHEDFSFHKKLHS